MFHHVEHIVGLTSLIFLIAGERGFDLDTSCSLEGHLAVSVDSSNVFLGTGVDDRTEVVRILQYGELYFVANIGIELLDKIGNLRIFQFYHYCRIDCEHIAGIAWLEFIIASEGGGDGGLAGSHKFHFTFCVDGSHLFVAAGEGNRTEENIVVGINGHLCGLFAIGQACLFLFGYGRCCVILNIHFNLLHTPVA